MNGNGTSNGRIDTADFIRNLHVFNFLTRHNLESLFLHQATKKSISFVQMNLLRVLAQHPGQTVGNIARFMNVSYPAATKTIDKLVRLGFLKRKEDPHDRRIAHLFLTPSGQRSVDKYDQHKSDQINLVLERLGPQRAAEFNRQIHEFAAILVDVTPPAERPCIQCGAFDPEDCYDPEQDEFCNYLEPNCQAD